MTKSDILDFLSNHKEAFLKRYGVTKIGLFGSYARAEASSESDIDLFVKMEPSLFNLIAFKEEIENNLHVKVDVIRDHKNIKPFLRRMISKDIIYVD